jgi:hypothetical protein
MKRSAVLAALALCGCSGNGLSPIAGASIDRVPHLVSPVVRSATKEPLLFVSDAATAEVYIYQLSTLKLLNSVTGFTDPQGECSDTKGDVWVTDPGAFETYELSHQGRLENTISGSGYAVGCAWDPSSGNVAIMDVFSGSNEGGDVLVYPKGRGSPHDYTAAKQFYYNFGGYDANGNLFFDGRSESGAFMLSELPKRAQKAITIAISGGTIYYPGMVQWDASSNELIVGDQSCGGVYTASCLYAIQIANQKGTIESTIDLQNSSGGEVCDLVQGVIYKGELAGSDNNICGSSPSTTYVWPYPAGGAPSRSNSSTDSLPIGAAVSL